MKPKKNKRLVSVLVSACMALPFLTDSLPVLSPNIAAVKAEAAYGHDDDLVLRYNSMAGYVNTDNAFNNDE